MGSSAPPNRVHSIVGGGMPEMKIHILFSLFCAFVSLYDMLLNSIDLAQNFNSNIQFTVLKFQRFAMPT